MEASLLLRLHSTERPASTTHEEFADAAISSWESVAKQIIAVIGEAGFESLFARCVFLTKASFPWLTEPTNVGQDGPRFAKLRINFEGERPDVANDANRLLMDIFVDTLVSLIGEPLTERILNSAGVEFGQYRTNRGDRDDQSDAGQTRCH